MPHPFFDVRRYPWSLEAAQSLHRALYQSVKQAAEIDLIYEECSGELDPLDHQAPRLMWKAALDAIATAGLLKVLGERLRARRNLVDANSAFDVASKLKNPIELPVMSSGRIFFDRQPLRRTVDQMGTADSTISVLLVRGKRQSGKTWTKHLIEDMTDAVGDESVYLAAGLVATVTEAMDRIFAVLNGRVPPKLTTDDAWFRKACTEMARLAAKRGKSRYWIIADDLNGLDPMIRQFFDQAALEMQSRAFSKWFRLVLIDYPDSTIPTKWKGFWSEDRPRESQVNKQVLSGFLLQWSGYKKKGGLETKAEKLAAGLIAKTKKAAKNDRRPRLERIHDELAVLLATL